MAQDYSVIRNDAEKRFETTVDGALCVLDYRLSDGVLFIDHTGVPTAVSGRGIAAALTESALETARREGWQVVANCAYAAAYIARHPQYRPLLAGP